MHTNFVLHLGTTDDAEWARYGLLTIDAARATQWLQRMDVAAEMAR